MSLRRRLERLEDARAAEVRGSLVATGEIRGAAAPPADDEVLPRDRASAKAPGGTRSRGRSALHRRGPRERPPILSGDHTRQQEEKERREQRQEQTEREAARRAWLADGGREEDFEREWPQLRDEARRRRVMHADQAARAAQRATGISKI